MSILAQSSPFSSLRSLSAALRGKHAFGRLVSADLSSFLEGPAAIGRPRARASAPSSHDGAIRKHSTHNAETVDSGERFIQLLAVKSARKLMGQSCQDLCCCAWTMEWQLCLPRASTTHRPQPANICGASTLMQLAHALAAACAQPARLHRASSALSRPSPP